MNKKLIRKIQTASGGPIDYKKWDNRKITSYTIPYIKEKVIKLTNAGKATGAKLSINLLDSIADNAYRAGLPIRKGLGIAFKESTFGNPTDDKSAWNLSSKIRELFNGEYPGTYLHINNGHTVLGQHLINYHKGDINHEVFYEDNPDAHKSIILEAFEFYKQHPDKYNPGQKNYQLLIDKLGDEAMQSPEILKWYEEWEKSKAQIFRPEPYKINTNIQNTVQEFVPHNKQGGKMNVLEFLKNGGQVRKMQTAAGGPIFIFNPAVIGSKLGKNFNNLYLYGKSYLLNKFIGPGKGEVIDLSKRKVSRIKRNTSNVSSILTNEFVERNNNVIRKKKDFVNTTDTLLGDNKIPLSKISTFYGIENGKLKAGPLKIFNDTTTVIPNRAKYVGKVKEFYPGKNNSKKYKKVINEAINRYNIDHGYFPSTFDKIFGSTHPTRVLRNNVSSKDYFGILEQLHNKYKHLEDGKDAYVITENNDTIKNYDLNATPKTLFADENGNAIFVASPHNHVKEINKMLLLHSMYPVMVDNGRYSAYLTQSPNAEIYSGFSNPNDMFLLGTISKRQGGMLELLKNGSGIHIKKKNRGKFREYCGGEVTDECIRKAKASGNPTLVKRATFAANARKWKHLEGGIINPTNEIEFYKNWINSRKNKLHENMGYLGDVDAEISRLINNILEYTYENTNSDKFIGETDHKNKVVRLTPNSLPTTLLHEIVHTAIRKDSPQILKVKQLALNLNIIDYDYFNELWKKDPSRYSKDIKKIAHYEKFNEFVPRLYEFRMENNLDPNKEYEEEEIIPLMLKSNIPSIKEGYYNPKTFTKALNEVAYNSTSNKKLLAKKGGKAFVEGVNVLDSNPKMSKAASRRVKKADDGTKLNAFLKVENFFNSDTGKTIGRTLMNGLSAGFQAKQMNDAINEYELASKAKLKKIMNGISTKDYYDQVLLQMNPNENLSLVVLNTRAYALALLDALKKVNEAKDESALQLNKIKQFASEQNLYNLSNVLGGISLLGSLLNNKPASKVDNGTPSNSYFDNYANNYTKQLFNIKS